MTATMTGALFRRVCTDTCETINDVARRAARLRAPGRIIMAPPGAVIGELRRLRVEVEDAMTYAVLTDRARGHSWDVIAQRLGETPEFVVKHYAPIEDRYRRGESIHPDGTA